MPDGYVTIVGRAKDLIISGGLNIYPKEIESVIDALEGVAESAVIGVPHPDFGEGVLAVVKRREGARALDAEAIIAGAARPARGLQDAQARGARRRAAAQQHGQGAEEPAARRLPGRFPHSRRVILDGRARPGRPAMAPAHTGFWRNSSATSAESR